MRETREMALPTTRDSQRAALHGKARGSPARGGGRTRGAAQTSQAVPEVPRRGSLPRRSGSFRNIPTAEGIRRPAAARTRSHMEAGHEGERDLPPAVNIRIVSPVAFLVMNTLNQARGALHGSL